MLWCTEKLFHLAGWVWKEMHLNPLINLIANSLRAVNKASPEYMGWWFYERTLNLNLD
jgi:hypothetical protein